MNNRAVPQSIADIADIALKPITADVIDETVEYMYGLCNNIVEVLKITLRSGVRSPAALDSLLKCVDSGEFEYDYAYCTGLMDAETEVYEGVEADITVLLVAFLTSLLDWMCRNRVTVLLSTDTQKNGHAQSLLELYGQWVQPVSDIFVSSCMGTELPMAATRTAEVKRVRGRSHFELMRRAPEQSQAFIKSLSSAQTKSIEAGLTPYEAVEFQTMLESARKKPLGVAANRNDAQHAALMLEPSFDVGLLKDANDEQLGLLGTNKMWGPLFKAAVKSAKNEQVNNKSFLDVCDSLWRMLEAQSDLEAALQIESLTGTQLLQMLQCINDRRVNKLNQWMGISTSDTSMMRPGVIGLIKRLKEVVNHDGAKVLEANPVGYEFAMGLFGNFAQDELMGLKLPRLVLDEHKDLLEAVRQRKDLKEVVTVWLGPLYNVTDAQRVLEVLRMTPLFMT